MVAETDRKEVLKDALKKFTSSVNSSSVNDQKLGFGAIQENFQKEDLSGPIVKGILKTVLTSYFVRYNQKKSLQNALALIQFVVQPSSGGRGADAWITFGQLVSNVLKSRSLGEPSARLLKWVVRHSAAAASGDHGKDVKKAIGQTILELTYAVYRSGCRNAIKRTEVFVMKPKNAAQIADILATIDGNADCMSDIGALPLLGLLMKASESDDRRKLWAERSMDVYTKAVIGAKTPLSEDTLTCFKGCVGQMTKEDLESKLLPVIKKALLRSPEVAIPIVCSMLNQLQLDGSFLVADLIKPLGSQLIGKNDELREVVSNGIKGLARLTVDSTVALNLVKHLTGLYNEEGVMETALHCCVSWAGKCTNELPEALTAFYRDILASKKSSSTVKAAVIRAANLSYKTNTLSNANELSSALLNAVDTGLKPNQPLIEALPALPLLLKLLRINTKLDGKLDGLWKLIGDGEPLFTSPKLVASLNEDRVKMLLEIGTLLVRDYADKLPTGDYPREISCCFLLALICPFYPARKAAEKSIGKVLGGLEGAKFALDTLNQLGTLLSDGWMSKAFKSMVKKEDVDEEALEEAFATLVAKAVRILTSVPEIGAQAEQLALAAFPLCALPNLVKRDASTWPSVVSQLKLDPQQVVKRNVSKLFDQIQSYEPQMGRSGILLLTGISPWVVWADMLLPRLGRLPLAELRAISREQADIALTRPGELYDQSVIQGIIEENETALKGKNMKRESKAYSYKDQVWEMELRRELAAKQGGMKDKFTPKQKEQIQNKLNEESTVREETLNKTNPTRDVLRLVESAVEGTLEWRSGRGLLGQLIAALKPLFSLPIVSSYASNVWRSLGATLFRSVRDELENLPIYFDGLLANCSLRLFKTDSVGPAGQPWTVEPLNAQAERTLRLLSKVVGMKTVDDDEDETGGVPTTMEMNGTGGEDDDENVGTPLPMDVFTFVLPLIRAVLIERPTLFSTVDDHRETVHQLALALAHLHLDWKEDQNDLAVLLPIGEICTMLLEIIGGEGSTGGLIQQGASQCLVDFVNAAVAVDDLDTAPLLRALLTFLKHPNEVAREYCLKTIEVVPEPDEENKAESSLCLLYRNRLFVTRWDEIEECQTKAKEIWESRDLEIAEEMLSLLLDDVVETEDCVRTPAASALADYLKQYPGAIPGVLENFRIKYEELSAVPPPEYDGVGRLVKAVGEDVSWESRCGLALALKSMSPLLPSDLVQAFFIMIVPEGLKDRKPDVRNGMLQAAVEALKHHGEEHVGVLLPMLEGLMDNLTDSSESDLLRQSLVVLLGTLAQHLDPEDPKIKPIVAKLIESLSTPSQQVQEAVAQCLPPLIPAIQHNTEELSNQLLGLLLSAEHYGERRGAAYGIAGLVKGLGIKALRQLEIMKTLQEALQNKKVPRHREGALLAMEMLCATLGKLFEPYVVQILPNLLLSLGDNDQHVREAADECAKVVMGNLSGHGVKLVLPSLLKALEEDSWRTKCGSVELLGAMAFCAPKQLGACLPQIVPHLIEVLSDSHMKVQKAGEQALKQIGRVIRNPEIQSISGVLLGALEDPANKTASCLQTLLKTKFVHYVDAPSLALIMPVIKRAFEDRSTETRKMAAQIISNIYSLSDQKDVEPYMNQMLPGLKKCVVDPVPEIRGTAAKAFGCMIEAGAPLKKEILPWLKERLVSETNSVDRSGAAQGLAEVFRGLGVENLEQIMPEIIATAESNVAPHIRDGYIMLYIYLPTVFGDIFIPYLKDVVPSILQALADESEYVRDTALKAGQRLISAYCERAIPLLLPQLERGLFNDNWRIRYSSVQLLGDFLFKITGVSGKMTTESKGEDDTFGSESMSKALSRVLGEDRKNRVLAGIYVARSDVALHVRQASGHVWKIIVSNTPRTLKEILPLLFNVLLGCLASPNPEKQQIAARCLGELVRKMGDRILVDVVPVLEDGLKSKHADQRQGVCIALSEIMSNTTREMVLMYSESLVPTVRIALSDELAEVRNAAASTFETLLGALGPQAMDDVIAPLIEKLDEPEVGEYTLRGLESVLKLKGKDLLPFLIPKLTGVKDVNSKALARLSGASGDAIIPHLNKVLDALLAQIAVDQEDEEVKQETLEMLTGVCEPEGVSLITDILLTKAGKGPGPVAIASAQLLSAYAGKAKVPLKDDGERLLEGLLALFVSPEEKVVTGAIEALGHLVKTLEQKEQIEYVHSVKSTVDIMVRDLNPAFNGIVPGFRYPKGLQPLLAILREGVLSGGPDVKERSALALGTLINASEVAGLKPHVVNVTGPLIRILGDRFPPHVKTAILNALTLFLNKVGILLKPFLPQLQSTFMKAIGEVSSREVRLRAAAALSLLATIHPKSDTLAADLVKNIKNNEDIALLESLLGAMRGVTGSVGGKLSEDRLQEMISVVTPLTEESDDTARLPAAAALGAIAACGNFPAGSNRREAILFEGKANSTETKESRSIMLLVALKLNQTALIEDVGRDKIKSALLTEMSDDNVSIICNGMRGAGLLILNQLNDENAAGGIETGDKMITALARGLNHGNNDVKLLAAQVLHHVALAIDPPNRPINIPFLKMVIPMSVNGTKEKNSGVRMASEEALVELLRLRAGDKDYQTFLSNCDSGPRGTLEELHGKTLAKLSKKPGVKPEPLDNTLLF